MFIDHSIYVVFGQHSYIVDLACEIMHNTDKTGAWLRKLAFLELSPRAGPLCTETRILKFQCCYMLDSTNKKVQVVRLFLHLL